MDCLLAKINRKVKQTEKHLEIKIIYQGVEIDTLFDRFFSFSYESAVIILHSPEKKKRYKLHYDFITGNLTDVKSKIGVEVVDLFSSRHLRSILFAAHEALILNSSEKLSAFTLKIHKEHPNPVFCTQTGSEKKWFLIDSIDIVNNSKIYMDGLVSIDNTYAHQPTKSKCMFDIKKKQFIWDYTFNGNKKKEVENENYYSFYKIKMSDILYSYTEYRIENPNLTGHTPAMQNMVNDMLKVFKKQRILIVTKMKDEWSNFNSEYINALFWDIKSVSNEEIVLLACDGETLNEEVIFNRINKKIYAFMPGLGKENFQQMIFTHDEKGSKNKFYKVIKLIENQLVK